MCSENDQYYNMTFWRFLWDAEQVVAAASVAQYQCGPWTKGSEAHCLRITIFLDVTLVVTKCYLLVGLGSEKFSPSFQKELLITYMCFILLTQDKMCFL
jgi:hypothetical protein